MPAFQVRIAYLTPHRRSRRYFHNIIVLAGDQPSALAEGRLQLMKRSHGAQIVHQTATLRRGSRDVEAAMLDGRLRRDRQQRASFRSRLMVLIAQEPRFDCHVRQPPL